MFKEIIESVDAKEDKEVIKKMKKLLDDAYKYGDRNLKSDWGINTVMYTLEEVISDTEKLKEK